jgi:hypothetical protein
MDGFVGEIPSQGLLAEGALVIDVTTGDGAMVTPSRLAKNPCQFRQPVSY